MRRFYLWLPHRRRVAAGLVASLAAAILVLAWLPGDGGTHSGTSTVDGHGTQPGEPIVLAVSLQRAPQGAPLTLTGLPEDVAGGLYVRIGGQPAPMRRQADGSLLVLVPLQPSMDGGWPVPPTSRQRIEVRRGDTVVAVGDTDIRILELPRAPGTTAGVLRSLDTIVGGFERIFADLPAHGEHERAMRQAVMAMLRGLVREGQRSLAAMLAESPPDAERSNLALTDAVLASSGAAAYLEAYAAALGPAASAGAGATRPGREPLTPAATLADTLHAAASDMLASRAGPGARTPGQLTAAWLTRNLFAPFPTASAHTVPPVLPRGGSIGTASSGTGSARCRNAGQRAFEIACLMQAHALLEMYSRMFVKPTADAYANTVGMAAALLGMFEKTVPGHAVIGGMLAVVDFAIGKISLSLLPARLETFELNLNRDLLTVDEVARPTIELTARNTPMTVTVGDLVTLVRAFLGPVEFNDAFKRQVASVFELIMELYQSALRNTGAPSAVMDAGVFTLPPKQWGPARVTSDDLVTLFSGDESIVATRKRELEWVARGHGQTRVRVQTAAAGERSKVLRDHSLCPGCVWTGGAFGEDVQDASRPVSVGVELRAVPHQGQAPLAVRLRWKLARTLDDSVEPVPCTIDFGDGSATERIDDCRQTQSIRHEYRHTSRLEDETGGAHVATIRLGGSGPDGSAEVFTEWSFRGTPEAGPAPLDANFRWDIPWPPGRRAPRCEFDPGDGSERQTFDDCLATRRTSHTFERRGSFAPSLTIIDGDARDTRTAPVSVSEPGLCDADLLKASRWQGTVSYQQSRDVWDPGGRYHVKYGMEVSLIGDLVEGTRREDRGVAYLVQYRDPQPAGSASIAFSTHEYSNGELTSYQLFNGGGPMRRQEPDMVEDGSVLSLVLNAKKCNYQFYLQGQTAGSGERWRKGGDKESYRGHRWIHSVRHEGVVESNRLIAGTATFPVLTNSSIEGVGTGARSWVNEYDIVSSALNRSGMGLGTVTVSWHFTPVD